MTDDLSPFASGAAFLAEPCPNDEAEAGFTGFTWSSIGGSLSFLSDCNLEIIPEGEWQEAVWAQVSICGLHVTVFLTEKARLYFRSAFGISSIRAGCAASLREGNDLGACHNCQ